MTSKIITEIENIAGKVFGSTAGTEVKTLVLDDVTKLVAYLKTTTVGTAALNIVSDLDGKTTNADGSVMTGTQKLEAAVVAVLPIAEQFLLSETSITGQIPGIEDAVRSLVQDAYTGIFSEIKTIIATILTDLGIK